MNCFWKSKILHHKIFPISPNWHIFFFCSIENLSPPTVSGHNRPIVTPKLPLFGSNTFNDLKKPLTDLKMINFIFYPLYKYQSPQRGFEGSREISAQCGAEYFAKHHDPSQLK